VSNNPLLGLAFLWIGTLIHVVAWIALAVFLFFSGIIHQGWAIAIGAFGSGLSFAVLYYFYKRLTR
jgi:hypothetical protein